MTAGAVDRERRTWSDLPMWRLTFVIIATLVTGCASTPISQSRLRVLHTTDVHGRFAGGLTAVASYVDQARSEPAKPWMDMERADLRMVESPSLSWAFPVLPLALAFQNFFRVR